MQQVVSSTHANISVMMAEDVPSFLRHSSPIVRVDYQNDHAKVTHADGVVTFANGLSEMKRLAALGGDQIVLAA